MTIGERVYALLSRSKRLTAKLVKDRLGRCIYHGRSPDAGSYPIIVYSIISDVPALAGDGFEIERKVTVRIHILTKDARYEEIYEAVQEVMLSAGFLRYSSQEFAEKELFVKMVDYKIGTGVDD